MGYIIHMKNRDQFYKAFGVLSELPGMWHAQGTPESPILLITEAHY